MPINTLFIHETSYELLSSCLIHFLESNKNIKLHTCKSSNNTATLIYKHKPEVIVMLINHECIANVETVMKLVRLNKQIKIIVISNYKNKVFIRHVLNAGASGYLTYHASPDELFEAIDHCHRGKNYLDKRVAHTILSVSRDETDEDGLNKLTRGELIIMVMIVNGSSIDQISDELHMDKKTIYGYRHRINTKLSVNNDVELLFFSIKHGLLNEYY